MLAHVPGVKNAAANYLSRLDNWIEDRIHKKLIDSVPVFFVGIDIALKTPKQEEDETDYYPHDEGDENIRRHRSNTPDNEPSGQTEQEQTTTKETDTPQMTARGATEHRKTSPEDQRTFFRVANTSSLPTRVMKSVSPENMVKLQVVQENKRDIPKMKTIFSDQQALPTHVNPILSKP